MSHISPSTFCSELIVLDEVDSTSSHLKQLSISGAKHGTIVVANSQTAGRGRLGRSFHSPAGKGIYMSILLNNSMQFSKSVELTAFAAVATCQAIEETLDIIPKIKWMNDITINDKKFCGILTETIIQCGKTCNVIVGIGINVDCILEDFPPQLQGHVTSLSMHTAQPINRVNLIAEIILSFARMYETVMTDITPYRKRYIELSSYIGRNIYVYHNGKRRPAYVVGINDDFTLHVRYEDGTEETLHNEETSVRNY